MPGYGGRYWADRTVPHRRRQFPAFRGDTTADVVIIGGGLTGVTAAYVLASGGLDVVLVEAGRLASGGTADGLGAIVPEPDVRFRDLEAARGLRVARTVWQESRRSALDFASALKRFPSKRDLDQSQLVINARSAEALAPLRKEQASRKAAGLDAPWLSAPASQAETGTATDGALRLREAFVHDPVRSALACAAAADAKGARLYERSPVRKTTFTRKYADVILRTGTIRTQGVFVATGTPGPLFKQLRRHVREQDAYVVVTEPLDAKMRRAVGRRNAILTEFGNHPHWLRWLDDNRAMFAGAAAPPVASRLADRTLIQRTGQLMYELSVRYPVISGLPARWSWRVPLVSTADGVPWIGPHRNFPFHFFAMALGWNGDTFAWLAAKAALRYFKGEARREDEAFYR
jgi:glycine/D-amino acid oxidase-like deaminating enzyme